MSSPYRRTLPSAPDLAQQKKQAKELLRSFQAGRAEDIARVRDVLPDKPRITLTDAQFVLAREYGFASWSALARHIESSVAEKRSPLDRMHAAFGRRDAKAVRQLLDNHPEFRKMINEPVFAFNSPPIVAFANDLAMVEVLLEYGADPNQRSEWWAGGFHALHSARGAAAERLLAGGAAPDACGAANLDRPDLLASMIAADPERVRERGGDGQTPLHFARSRAVVDLLLEAGADPDARDVDHRSTPAEWMLDRNRGAGRYDLAAHLVDRGATADIFMAAALGLRDRLREMLLHDSTLLNLRTGRGPYGEIKPSSYHIYFWTIGDGRSPLDVAAQFGQEETLEMLWDFASPIERFLCAARAGDEARTLAMLREDPGIITSMRTADHRALTDAAWAGNARAVALMLKLGFDPGARGQDTGTALHCAAWQGSIDSVGALLSHPAGRALLPVRDLRHGATPLGWCCHGSRFANTGGDYAGIATMLLRAGAQLGSDTSEASPQVEAVLEAWH